MLVFLPLPPNKIWTRQLFLFRKKCNIRQSYRVLLTIVSVSSPFLKSTAPPHSVGNRHCPSKCYPSHTSSSLEARSLKSHVHCITNLKILCKWGKFTYKHWHTRKTNSIQQYSLMFTRTGTKKCYSLRCLYLCRSDSWYGTVCRGHWPDGSGAGSVRHTAWCLSAPGEEGDRPSRTLALALCTARRTGHIFGSESPVCNTWRNT